jgi:CheY-like chemotaxis protein
MGKILVVDDSEYILDQMNTLLEQLNLEPILATNGFEALSVVNNPENDISLIFLDMIMPKMTGIEFLEKTVDIRNSKNITVIGLSSQSDPEILNHAQNLYCQGWMIKPPELQKLQNFVARYFTS